MGLGFWSIGIASALTMEFLVGTGCDRKMGMPTSTPVTATNSLNYVIFAETHKTYCNFNVICKNICFSTEKI